MSIAARLRDTCRQVQLLVDEYNNTLPHKFGLQHNAEFIAASIACGEAERDALHSKREADKPLWMVDVKTIIKDGKVTWPSLLNRADPGDVYFYLLKAEKALTDDGVKVWDMPVKLREELTIAKADCLNGVGD